MLRDAILRTLAAAEIVGIGAVLVHAISERSKRFHVGFGFAPSELEPMTLMITLKEAAAELARGSPSEREGRVSDDGRAIAGARKRELRES